MRWAGNDTPAKERLGLDRLVHYPILESQHYWKVMCRNPSPQCSFIESIKLDSQPRACKVIEMLRLGDYPD